MIVTWIGELQDSNGELLTARAWSGQTVGLHIACLDTRRLGGDMLTVYGIAQAYYT